ncbi:TPA: hypothetical protein ACQ7E7_005151, partial [Klebsiella pneumoniae]
RLTRNLIYSTKPVEIKMLAMAVPQKVRMQIIRHGVG